MFLLSGLGYAKESATLALVNYNSRLRTASSPHAPLASVRSSPASADSIIAQSAPSPIATADFIGAYLRRRRRYAVRSPRAEADQLSQCASRPSNHTYNVGNTSRLSSVAERIPPITTVASGR